MLGFLFWGFDFSKKKLVPKEYLSHVITITSETGVGSSTLLKTLREYYGDSWNYASGGSVMREKAAGLGMSIEEFAEYNREHPEKGYDLECDKMLAAFGRQNYTVIESRMAHMLVPHAFHVRLVCHVHERARRRARDEPEIPELEIRERIVKRDHDDSTRLEALYPGCLWEDRDFNLVIDTEQHTPPQVLQFIVEARASWAKRVNASSRSHI